MIGLRVCSQAKNCMYSKLEETSTLVGIFRSAFRDKFAGSSLSQRSISSIWRITVWQVAQHMPLKNSGSMSQSQQYLGQLTVDAGTKEIPIYCHQFLSRID